MKQKFKWLVGILLSLSLMFGMMPGMSLTAYADDTPPYANLKNTTTVMTFDGKSWYLTDYDDTTVTLLSKECVGASAYNSSGGFVEYSNNPTVKTAVDNWYNNNITADAKTAVSGGAMFLLTKDQANALSTDVKKCSQASGADVNGWWLCSQGYNSRDAAFVDGGSGADYDYGLIVDDALGVRPALKLNLSSVIFSSETKTFSLKPAGDSVTPSGDKNAANAQSAAVSGTFTIGGMMYNIQNGSATVTGMVNKNAKKAVIPDTVIANGQTIPVTAIAPEAFFNMKKLKSATIGANIEVIGAKAFFKCKNLKTIKILTSKLTKQSVGGKAFGKTHPKAKVKVPKAVKKAYKKFLYKKGLKKSAKIK